MIHFKTAAKAALVATYVLWTPIATQAETLADALASAYTHSGLIDKNRALLRVADEDVAIAAAALKPIITWSSSITYTDMGGASLLDDVNVNLDLNAELLLYDFGASATAVESQKELVLSTRETLKRVEQEILFRAVEAYVDVRSSSESLALRQSNVRVITQELRAARDRFDVGEVTRTDVALAEARLASARSLLASAEGQLQRDVAEYVAAVGRKPGRLATPSANLNLANSIERATAIAFRTHPAILKAQHDVSATELNIRRAELAMSPTLRGTARVRMDEDRNVSKTIGLQAGATIYRGGELSARLRQAQARRDASRADLHIVRHQVEQGVVNAYSLLEVANASRQASERQIRASRVAFRGVREEATLGARTTLDVLNAEQELLDAEAGLITAQSDEVRAAYGVLSSMGLLTAEHLGLAVQVYDPAAYYNLVKDAPAIRSDQGAALDRVLRSIGKE